MEDILGDIFSGSCDWEVGNLISWAWTPIEWACEILSVDTGSEERKEEEMEEADPTLAS